MGTFSPAWLVLERGVSLSFERNCWRRRDDLFHREDDRILRVPVKLCVCVCVRVCAPASWILVSPFVSAF